MLDEYQKNQPIVYKTLINSVKKNKYSHAYLFETKGYPNGLNLAIAYAKYLFCPHHYSNPEMCKDCFQCQTINDNNFIELKIIQPDGMWIKKEQLTELQQEFNKKALSGNKKIYIINNADKLNISSANSILKFLEEPEENIIAILIVDNQYQVLDTIKSRCQIITFANHKKREENLSTKEKLASILIEDETSLEEFMKDEKIDEKINHSIEFIKYYENHGLETLLHMQKLWHQYFQDKESIDFAFQIILLYYIDILNHLLDRPLEIFNQEESTISMLSKTNTINKIMKKINILLEKKENIRYNLNTNLLLDKLILDWEGENK